MSGLKIDYRKGFLSPESISMEHDPRIYTIRIQGALNDRWKNWFDGMTVTNLEGGQAIIEGIIQDQSVLVGVINQIHSLNLKLISINCKEQDSNADMKSRQG